MAVSTPSTLTEAAPVMTAALTFRRPELGFDSAALRRDELPMTPSGKSQKFVLREDVVKGVLVFDEVRPTGGARHSRGTAQIQKIIIARELFGREFVPYDRRPQ